MSVQLPSAITNFIQAQNEHNTEALLHTMVEDTVFIDEGKQYNGFDQIRRWSDRVNQEYQVKFEVLEVARLDEDYIVTAKISGTFEDSPIQLEFHFTLIHDKIKALTVK